MVRVKKIAPKMPNYGAIQKTVGPAEAQVSVSWPSKFVAGGLHARTEVAFFSGRSLPPLRPAYVSCLLLFLPKS
jgi:hypothetical protein